MTDFCTVSDVENLLQITITGDADAEAACEQAIDSATEAIRNYTRQQIDRVSDEEITLDVWVPRWNIVLPELPVVSVGDVVEDDTTLTPGDDEDYVLAQYGQLIRRGRRWKVGPQILTITYTHGYETIPEDIADVCTALAARRYQMGLQTAEMEGVPVESKSIGDFSVSYAVGAGGMSSGAAGDLLRGEKEKLDKYRPGA